ncbi:hypothetical protein DJ021_06420 [Phenylobacterium hankyongense]|uniref:ATP-binding protein n=1 Tax=Phenylobacterium hankyongense TaxID=1813876 RepID=A0A328B0S6_9CAUL|nr:ATP-binding protein [Phenylobacterium hankyongense]RAK59464.1 hypothetical protein DJ021_06420 [Phenylobacterium hankyongense]
MKTIGAFKAPPDSAGSARAFSRIGYDLAEALADLIDNSIDAEASLVEITFFRNTERLTAVTIADDGRGMSASALKTAMQFATSVRHKPTDLGTFGLGMKSASFSQCHSLTVVSRQAGKVAACRWTDEAIKADWRCELLDPKEAEKAFAGAFSSKGETRKHGTVVVWDRLDRLGAAEGELDEFLAKTMSQLEIKLGLVFHRFIARSGLKILLRAKSEQSDFALPHVVKPLDPFAYPAPGKAGYPKTFTTNLPGAGQIKLEGHIWPPGAASPEFLLGRRRATPHQGFYFYRNNRLIQAGGWNDFLKDTNDPELALARIAVDLPSEGTATNVQKSAIQVSTALTQALSRARAGGSSLADYLEDARAMLRSQKRRPRANAAAPAVPGVGVPVQVRRNVRKLVAKKGVAREIDFAWESLPKGKVFDLDRVDDRIVLNKKYRHLILGHARASGADAPVVKTLLFLLLQDDFSRARFSAQRREWIRRCNAVLLEAVKTL